MSLDIMTVAPLGDKKNCLKIYERRKKSGLEELLKNICALVVQVETGDALSYLEELYLMTPYRLLCTYLNETHKIYFLESKPELPHYIVLEPLEPSFTDDLTRLNMLYPLARRKPNARYVGEVLAVDDLAETRTVLESHNIRFHHPDETENKFFSNPHFYFTFPSSITGNRVGYTPRGAYDIDAMEIGEGFQLTDDETNRLNEADARAREKGAVALVLGVDHMATRVLSGERFRRTRGRDSRIPDHVQLLLLGRLQHRRSELFHERQSQRLRGRRQALTRESIHRQQHPFVRQLLRRPSDADGRFCA
jgi:hypothetical protein